MWFHRITKIPAGIPAPRVTHRVWAVGSKTHDRPIYIAITMEQSCEVGPEDFQSLLERFEVFMQEVQDGMGKSAGAWYTNQPKVVPLPVELVPDRARGGVKRLNCIWLECEACGKALSDGEGTTMHFRTEEEAVSIAHDWEWYAVVGEGGADHIWCAECRETVEHVCEEDEAGLCDICWRIVDGEESSAPTGDANG